MRGKYIILAALIAPFISANAQVFYSGTQPGKASAMEAAGKIRLENKVLTIDYARANGRLFVSAFRDKNLSSQIKFPARAPLFTLTLPDGSSVSSSDFKITADPVISDIPADTGAVKLSARMPGKRISATFNNDPLRLSIEWEAELKDGSNYVKESMKFVPKDSTSISMITMIALPNLLGAKRMGNVDGSPMVYKNMFFSIEHPMSQIGQDDSSSTAFMLRSLPLNAVNPFTVSAVWGVTPAKQLRRGFLYYVERERAAPYRQFLHYNSWFDISFADRVLTDSLCIDRIKTWGDSLIVKRNTPMNAFLFDDGWDDYKTLWQFNKGFPNGFTNVGNAAKKYNAGIGVWMSPWGGYDVRKPQRLEYGSKQNLPFETNENGFSLAGPVYYKRFSEVTLNFIRKYNVSIFKFDGVGAGNGVSGVNGKFERDVEAFLKLTRQIRNEKPNIFLSLTIGTWPSVYWLNYGDAIWRAGDDTGLRGKGTKRQQWINYRDAQAYQNIVRRAPLYPLNSVMYHGLVVADAGIPGKLEMDDKQIEDEMWSFFGTGTDLEEMYVNPHKLNTANWNALRDVVKWVRSNAEVMPDVHWIGGDPAREEVYGYAGWSGKKAYLTLRNPSIQTKTFMVNTATVFDLSPGAGRVFTFYDARAITADNDKKEFASGESFPVTLKPFEIKVLDAYPVAAKNKSRK